MLSMDTIVAFTFVGGTAIVAILCLLIGVVSWEMITKRKSHKDDDDIDYEEMWK